MSVAVKRVYAEPSRSDGTRVLVDRLWPRGLTKERAALDAWLRDLAPSDELRKWFHQHPQIWAAVRKRYLKELTRPQAIAALDQLYDLKRGSKQLTLLFASKSEERNNATVLRDLLLGMRKPPTGTGPGVVRTARERQVKRMPARS
jgi:uncharacterized protein YeaO (DUF488 family)